MVYKHATLQKENINVNKDIIHPTIMLHCEALIKPCAQYTKAIKWGY